jgi:hypothetical protein
MEFCGFSVWAVSDGLDGWAEEKRAILTESNAVVVAGGLSVADAVSLVTMVKDGAWAPVIEETP